MKNYIILLLLISIFYVNSEKNCEDIKPSKISDCVLSSEDKKEYKYCCYDKIDDKEAECDALTQATYEVTKDLAKSMEKTFGSKVTFECNSSYLKLSLISLLLILF